MTAIETGARVYDLAGREYTYLGPLGERHAVREMFDDDGDEIEGDERIVDRVFTSPPTQKRHEEVSRLDALLVERRKELHQIETRKHEQQRLMDANPQIAALVDLLAAKPVYLVTDSGEIVLSTERKDKHRVEGHFQWDGRMFFWVTIEKGYASTVPCRPFRQREQAIEEVRRIVERLANDENQWKWPMALESARAAGIEPPAGLAEKIRAKQIADADAAIKSAEDALTRTKAARAKLDEEPAK